MLAFALLAFGSIVATLFLASRTFVLITDSHITFVERFGVFNRALNPGLHVIIPFVERLHRTDWRTSEGIDIVRYSYERDLTDHLEILHEATRLAVEREKASIASAGEELEASIASAEEIANSDTIALRRDTKLSNVD